MGRVLGNQTIVQSNDLLEGGYKISLDEFRVLNLALAQIDSMNPEPKKPYIISVSDYQEAYGIDKRHSHVKLRDATRSLLRKPITLYRFDDKKNRIIGTERPWFSLIEYDASDASASVKVYFSPFVIPYLYELKKNFTSITFQHLAELDTPFSIRLYYWLSRYKNSTNTPNGIISVNLEIQWMKERSGLGNRYSEYKDLRRKVIDPAIEKINEVTDLYVTYEPIKQGKKVVSIKFQYILNKKPLVKKPLRPRLHRRPKVKKGSHEEGVWMRNNFNLLYQYRESLKAYDPLATMTLSDLRKMAEYASIFDDFIEKELRSEIKEREYKLINPNRSPKQPVKHLKQTEMNNPQA